MRRILLVDDDQAWGQAAAEKLRESGFDVVLVPDYRGALTELDSTRTLDLLITDIVMPRNVNGIALSRMALMRRHDIKVLYVSAYDVPGAADEALAPILRKPVNLDDLVAEVRRLVAA
jgi:DNA-binding NtrC family response regulator